MPPGSQPVGLTAYDGLQGARAYVVATNPRTVAAPTAYHGYCCVHQLDVCCLLGRCLHIRYGVLHGGFGISGLLCEKYPLIIRVVVPFLLWLGQQRCVRMLHVAGAGVRHTVAPSAGATCFARYACR